GETIALFLPEQPADKGEDRSLSFYLEKILMLEKSSEVEKKKFVTDCWSHMSRVECFVFNKLLTGSFRIGVSQKTVVNALAMNMNTEPSVIFHRISGNWDPSTTPFSFLLAESSLKDDASKPYPFFLSHALPGELTALGDPAEWQAEWK